MVKTIFCPEKDMLIMCSPQIVAPMKLPDAVGVFIHHK